MATPLEINPAVNIHAAFHTMTAQLATDTKGNEIIFVLAS
jgi:hypothetical protein